jgi:hypothetical protein
MAAGLDALKSRADQELVRSVPGADRKSLESLQKAIRDLCQHEDDRNLRVFRSEWRLDPLE